MVTMRAQAVDMIYQLPETKVMEAVSLLREMLDLSAVEDNYENIHQVRKAIDFDKYRVDVSQNIGMDAQEYIRELRDNDRF